MTKEELAVSNQAVSIDGMYPCNHEEADTCILVHTQHAVLKVYKKILIKGNDTDVLVIAVSVMPVL